jgi:hypothetical protein
MSLFCSCDKEDIAKNQGEALPSFSTTFWEFTDVTFDEADEGYIYINLFHYSDTNGLIDQIVLVNIPIDKDTTRLFYKKEGTNVHSVKSTSYYYINVGLDALGENYVIDSTKEDSYVILNCVSKNRITGNFRLNYVLSNTSLLPKFAPYIPDTFIIEEGKFNAGKL